MRSHALFAGALLVFWLMAVSVSPRIGATADERVHLVGGYSYWAFHDYRLQPENGNLTMRLQALPLLPMGLEFPSFDTDEWRQSNANDVGKQFVFGIGNPFSEMLWRSRAMVALFGVLTLWLIWKWTRGLFGPRAGWVALGTATFCPSLLAHAGLATSDMAITACFLTALSLCWQVLHRVTWLRLFLASMAVGAALLAKFSAVLLGPIAILLLLIRWTHPASLVIELGRQRRWIRSRAVLVGATAASAVAIASVAVFVVWAAYGFRYSAFNPEWTRANEPTPAFAWEKMLGPAPAPGTLKGSLDRDFPTEAIVWAKDVELLPEAYLYGFADSYKGSRQRPAFMWGKISSRGWPQFFPLAFILKTPPTQLVLFAAGISALILGWRYRHARRPVIWPRRGWFYRCAPLMIFAAVYGGVAINTPLNIGHRHLLPLYPLLHIGIGAAAGWLVLARRRSLAVLFLGGITLAHAVDSWGSRPFYLGYFTPWVGGTSQGWRYLVDSSLDWGQGLPDLERWIAAKEARGDRAPIYLTYFGTDSPNARKLPVTRFGDLFEDLEPRGFPAQVRGGWFVISATYYQGVYLGVHGPWDAAREKLYRELLQSLGSAPPDIATRPEPERFVWGRDARNYERLQFGRICHFVRQRSPDAFIGGSLLVFRLSEAEVQHALYGPYAGTAPTPVKSR